MNFADRLKEFSNPSRREILLLLRNGSMSAGDISSHFNLTGATISYHLSQLKKAGLVHESKYKNFVYYELNTSIFNDAVSWFSQFQNANMDVLNEA